MQGPLTRGIEVGLAQCESCDLVVQTHHQAGLCPRCGEPVHPRKLHGRSRAWAFLVAAAILYLPANTLVIMHTEQFPQRRDDTILSGIAYLVHEGAWGLGLLVFAASIVVPLLKIISLAVLLVTSDRRSAWRRRGRTALYRVLEVVGHWSMLDVFVVALLAAVVQLGRIANVEPGPAVLPFAGVVVLTMLASAAFDPRAIWDEVAND